MSCEEKNQDNFSNTNGEEILIKGKHVNSEDIFKDIKVPETPERKDDWMGENMTADEKREWTKKATEYLKSVGKDVPDYKPSKETSNQSNSMNDFEYSETWRQEAYKNTKKFMIMKLRKQLPKCKMVSQGSYHPNLVEFMGGQTFLVRIRSKFDCNENYINEIKSLVYATYDGNNQWTMILSETNLTH